jgi:hypothetical protein
MGIRIYFHGENGHATESVFEISSIDNMVWLSISRKGEYEDGKKYDFIEDIELDTDDLPLINPYNI